MNIDDFDLTRVRSRRLANKWADANGTANAKDRRAAVIVSGSAWGPLLLIHPADIPALAESLRGGTSQGNTGPPSAA